MSLEDNKAIVRRFFEELLGQGNMAAADELVDPNLIAHDSGAVMIPLPPGRQGVKQFFSDLRVKLPDLQISVDDLLAEGDKVAARWTVRGTNLGPFGAMAATGKQMTVTGIGIYRLAGGKIVEYWTELDMLGTMNQLGVIQLPAQAS
jgi:steroid delta-isomerase-like uncharacterized protein